MCRNSEMLFILWQERRKCMDSFVNVEKSAYPLHRQPKKIVNLGSDTLTNVCAMALGKLANNCEHPANFRWPWHRGWPGNPSGATTKLQQSCWQWETTVCWLVSEDRFTRASSCDDLTWKTLRGLSFHFDCALWKKLNCRLWWRNPLPALSTILAAIETTWVNWKFRKAITDQRSGDLLTYVRVIISLTWDEIIVDSIYIDWQLILTALSYGNHVRDLYD